ncbi:unnamed protein product, partial [Symbiodinium microadriaticum]
CSERLYLIFVGYMSLDVVTEIELLAQHTCHSVCSLESAAAVFAVMMMDTWLSLQWRRDPFEAALSAGALLLTAVGVVLSLVMCFSEMGLVPKQVERLTEAVWWGGAAILAAMLGYNHWCRPPQNPDGTHNSNSIPQAVAAAVAKARAHSTRAAPNLADEEELNLPLRNS